MTPDPMFAPAPCPLPADGALHLHGAGRAAVQAVTVIGEAPGLWRIRAMGTLVLPRAELARGDTALVPRDAVTFPAR